MKIVGQQPDAASVGQVAQSGTPKVGQAVTPLAKNERKSPGVGVTVSSQARALEQSGNTSDVDQEKVNAVRQAIEQKSFVVNAETIADKLLANAREMLDRTKG